MLPADHLAALRRDGDTLLAAAGAAGLDTPVPTCPGWDVARLVHHTGTTHRWATRIVEARAQERLPGRGVDAGEPADHDALAAWFSGGLDRVIDTLSAAGPDTPVWNWTGVVAPAAFWMRRMALETVVHRWDAENAGGAGRPVEPELAVDGIEELLEVFVPHHPGCRGLRGDGETLHLHCTDTAGEWLFRFVESGIEVSREHARGDAAVRGSASDLFLLLWGRRGLDGLEVLGDAGVAGRWPATVRI